MPKFATYLHPHTILVTKPAAQINFVGYSYLYFSQVRQGLTERLGHYPALPAREAALEDYLPVHQAQYLQKISRMAADEPVTEPPNWSIENSGLAYTLPGLRYGLGGLLEAVDQMKAGQLERAYCFSLGGHHAFNVSCAWARQRPLQKWAIAIYPSCTVITTTPSGHI